MQNDLLENNLSREEMQALRNRRTGMTIFQISWIMAFFCLIVVNWQLRYNFSEWPPEGVEKLGVILPSIATGMLLVSTFLVRRGLTAIQHDDRDTFFNTWRIAIGLAIAFVLIMIYEWVSVSIETQYGSLFRVMTGFHGVHALAIGAYLIMVYRNARDGQYGALDFWAVEAGAKLWYFVAVAWILFYTVLYWI